MNITELKELAEKAAGWKLDATMQTDDDRDEGIAFVGAINDEGIFSDVARIDTGLYYQPDKAIEVAKFIAAANPAAMLELIAKLEDAQGEIRALRATEAGLVERVKEFEEALSSLLTYADKNTCTHEETYRGGSIWTICRACDSKWADDEVGMPEWEDPKELAAARALLEKKE